MELSYEIKGKKYPKFILGCDSFLREPFVSSCKNEDKKMRILTIMEMAYSSGIIGIHVNIDSQYVVQAFKELQKRHKDVIGIGDPNMNIEYMLGSDLIKNCTGQLIKTVYELKLNENEKESIKNSTKYFQKFFFNFQESDKILSQKEINSIYLKKSLWRYRLSELSSCCEFCLFGASYTDWLFAINRRDIIEYEIKTIRENGMLPVSVCHWASRSLHELKRNAEIVAHWVFANKNILPIIYEDSYQEIKCTNNITAFRILRNFDGYNTIDDAVNWAFDDICAKSVVIGAPTDVLSAVRLFSEIRNIVVKS